MTSLQLYTLREARSSGKPAVHYFDTVLSGNVRNVEALLGKAKYYETAGHMDKATEILSALVVAFSRSGHYLNFFIFLFCKKNVRLTLFSSIPPSNSLVSVLDH